MEAETRTRGRERELAREPRERVVHTEPERKSVLGRIVGAFFATALGILAFIGLLVVLAIVLLFLLF